jgi:hypothetical protein
MPVLPRGNHLAMQTDSTSTFVKPLTDRIGDLDDDVPPPGGGHWRFCGGCGQVIDGRRPTDVRHHQQPGHRPVFQPNPGAWLDATSGLKLRGDLSGRYH